MSWHRHRSMAKRAFVSDDVYDVPGEPYQPCHLSFPARRFGKASSVHRSFQLVWFKRFKWIHYDVPRDAAFCHVCCKAIKEKVIKVSGLTADELDLKAIGNEFVGDLELRKRMLGHFD